ncbi:MAG: sigma-70 family RNA polymerase sigma factor [Oligoflexia bacterium]|nr:sigma-70 family RNA polymerase sigma factor [Oligoflexia bacterium]
MNSKTAFFEFYRAHVGIVRAVIYQIAGASSLDDLTQETFVRLWKGLKDFRGDSKIKSWVYRVSSNVALDFLRSQKRDKEEFGIDLSYLPTSLQNADKLIENHQLVTEGLKSLSPDHRAVVVLALIHELNLNEIADVLGISEGTVKSRLHYGKEHFRKILQKEGEILWAKA